MKQLFLHSGIYMLLSSGLFHILITNTCLIHEYVMLENKFWGLGGQNQTDRAIKLQWALLLK